MKASFVAIAVVRHLCAIMPVAYHSCRLYTIVTLYTVLNAARATTWQILVASLEAALKRHSEKKA